MVAWGIDSRSVIKDKDRILLRNHRVQSGQPKQVVTVGNYDLHLELSVIPYKQIPKNNSSPLQARVVQT